MEETVLSFPALTTTLFTPTKISSDAVHPDGEVTVTEYVVFSFGVTKILRNPYPASN